ncbi:glycoside hydrolase family 32 protein [Neobacillus sp. 179-C4.2 HS]|uniref:Sucrose-6-phosphate hydrolase n=1 Tax=Neobacillus driksii TaxID=3035913 RepID=A0ABV4YRZ8_9BACI|nr:glycoside hydrolase family 32 protein [Neobacillus sp. 179.-C4.2 HS]MDP5194291.1 glycoside hydrolase family 32 protein [Neobacillus sp. 179.-C4.2 HS]
MSDFVNAINLKHQEAINKANREIDRKKDTIKNSRYRLKYHFMAPIGWINDPNGLVQYKGEYQLFYQYYPYDSKWGPMHWGHAKSTDLVHWEHLPVALAPSESYDCGEVPGYGCFSGSGVVDGEELVLIYTGHVDNKEPMQVQCIATSKDGLQFEKHFQNPVIDDYPEDGSPDFRDPKVWKHDGKWYMVVGSHTDGKGKALLYVSTNLKDWDYVGVAAESNGTQGDMWECPDLFPLQNHHILLVSPMYGKQNEKPFYVIGEMDYEKGVFTQQTVRTLDYGFDFYAPQTLLDDNGRRIMIGWMEKWLTKMPSQQHGWAGAMTIPRELLLEGGTIVKQKPVIELENLRTNEKHYDSLIVENERIVNESMEESSEVIIDFDLNETTASSFGLQLRCSEDGNERTEIILDAAKKEIILDRNYAGVGEKGYSKAPFTINDDGTIQVRIFMDTTSVEVFVNDGEQVITNRIFPDDSSRLFKLFSKDGKVCVSRMTTWTLYSVWE